MTHPGKIRYISRMHLYLFLEMTYVGKIRYISILDANSPVVTIYSPSSIFYFLSRSLKFL